MKAWEKNLKKLQHYYDRHGHSNVPTRWESDRTLAQWIENMRASNRKLPKELRAELLKLKFNFEPDEDKSWEANYNRLVSYWKTHGHTYVPFEGKFEKLAQWAQTQRNSQNRLSKKQIEKLDEIDFDWTINSKERNSWERMFQELKKFKEKFGHTRVVHTDKPHFKLATWVHNLRARKHKLNTEQKRRLDDLGFLWSKDLKRLKEGQWTTRYEQLKDFKKRFGHCNVPIKWKENKKLSVWVSEQRLREKNKGLIPERKKLLDKIGFSWSDDLVKQYDQGWNKMLVKLKDFQSKYGHMRVPATERYRELKYWLMSQRIMYRRGYLPLEKQKRLDAIGFVHTNVRGSFWEKRYNQLKEFKKRYGTLKVPRKKAGPYAGLGEWITLQRQNNSKGILSKERKRKLDAIGFNWAIISYEEVWDKMYKTLIAFKKKYKHLQVPPGVEGYKSLRKWITRQRENRRNGTLSNTHFKILEAIGFEWEGKMKTVWQNKYNQLVNFKKKFKHLHVPSRKPEYKPLDYWMRKQREAWRNGTLLKDRYKMLDSIGFEWTPKTGRRKDEVYKTKVK